MKKPRRDYKEENYLTRSAIGLVALLLIFAWAML